MLAIEHIVPAALPRLISSLDDSDFDFRYRVVEAIGRLGCAAEPAIPQLLRLLDRDTYAVQRAAAEALVQIGPASVPGLRERASNLALEYEDAGNIAQWALAQIAASEAAP